MHEIGKQGEKFCFEVFLKGGAAARIARDLAASFDELAVSPAVTSSSPAAPCTPPRACGATSSRRQPAVGEQPHRVRQQSDRIQQVVRDERHGGYQTQAVPVQGFGPESTGSGAVL